jgi:hypothetical protein
LMATGCCSYLPAYTCPTDPLPIFRLADPQVGAVSNLSRIFPGKILESNAREGLASATAKV